MSAPRQGMTIWQTRREVDKAPQVTAVTEFNDSSLEYLIAAWRGLALLSMVGWFVATMLAVVGVPGRWGYVAVTLWLGSLLFGYLGFWLFGNSGWRGGHDGDH